MKKKQSPMWFVERVWENLLLLFALILFAIAWLSPEAFEPFVVGILCYQSWQLERLERNTDAWEDR